MATGEKYLKFRCTGCGRCCKDPLLPLTDADVLRIVNHTGDNPLDLIQWVDRNGIAMDDEPEAFVMLRQGKRVMVLRHERGGCRYLGADDRCSIYAERPIGCRVFPFDASFTRTGTLRRLTLIQATQCDYELDGTNSVATLRSNNERHETNTSRYHEKVAAWNRLQRQRKRQGKAAQTARDYLHFLGLAVPEPRREQPRSARAKHAPSA